MASSPSFCRRAQSAAVWAASAARLALCAGPPEASNEARGRRRRVPVIIAEHDERVLIPRTLLCGGNTHADTRSPASAQDGSFRLARKEHATSIQPPPLYARPLAWGVPTEGQEHLRAAGPAHGPHRDGPRL